MRKGRLEAFSDGVVAILITIMVLQLTTPQGTGWRDLLPLTPIFLSYVLSFVNIGIYWNNHHHLLQAVDHVDGRVLWANMHLLFWLSLIPFTTAWMGEHFAPLPVALYGIVLLCAAVAYTLLTRALIALHGRGSVIASAVGRDDKGNISLGLYFIAVVVAFLNHPVTTWSACALYVLVAVMWLVPDRRIERNLAQGKEE